MCDVWPQCLVVVLVLHELFDVRFGLGITGTGPFFRLDDPRRQNWCPVAASAIPSQRYFLTSFRGSCPPHLVFISCGSFLTYHHVESTVSPPVQRNALFSPARRCSRRHPGSRCSQLLCRLESKLFRPSEPGIKVCSAIGQYESAAKPMPDDREWLLHNAFGLLTRHEATVRLSDAQAWPQH